MTRTSLVRRQGDPVRPGLQVGERTLADLAPGAQGRIVCVAVPGSPETARRLGDLGFTAGTVVRMVRRAPLRDPVVYLVKDYEVALRRAQASCVYVTEVHQ